jgi:AmmeMemoRadiSam system protein B/AmmeMemoRadiSam system protein A
MRHPGAGRGWTEVISVLIALTALPLWGGEPVRPSALAGSWYPGDPEELSAYVDGALDAAGGHRAAEDVRALVVPHAGYRFSGATAAAAFALVRGRPFERVILLAPAHRRPFRGLSIAHVSAYETPLGRIALDQDAVAVLRASPLVTADPTAHIREHAIEIELPMLQRALAPGWRLLPILVGRLEAQDYETAADLLRPLADEDTLLVVSSDFTHYGARFGYSPFPLNDDTPAMIRALDEGALAHIAALDAPGLLDYQSRTGITICGYRPLALLLDLLPRDARVQRVAYATSGEMTADYANSVSYVALAVTSGSAAAEPGRGATQGPDDPMTRQFQLLYRLAVWGVEHAVLGSSAERNREIERTLAGLAPELKERAGAFVTLRRNGSLRGCIGTIGPRKPLYQAVLENGINAAVNDWRFRPVTPTELGELEVEVSVLSPPAPIVSIEEFRVGEHGIILEKGGRRAVFLPEVALEQGWSREETVSRLAQKAGLEADAWTSGARFEVFTSRKYGAPVRRGQ